MQDDAKKFGEQVEKETMLQLKDQVEKFSSNLEQFALKYKDEIKFNPDFREKFYLMCKEIGVDPLSSVSLWQRNLNLTEFYYNLAIQIITLCLTMRDKEGPLIEITKLKSALTILRKKSDISLLDIQKAIESVSELKCGFQIINLKSTQAIMTIPLQLSSDTNNLIELAGENKGCLGYSLCYDKLNMNKSRFENLIVKVIFYFSLR